MTDAMSCDVLKSKVKTLSQWAVRELNERTELLMVDVSCLCWLINRLTDLAPHRRRQTLAAFYGEDDNVTLQNVLHHVPNIVPQLMSCTSVTTDNDRDDDNHNKHSQDKHSDGKHSASAVVDTVSVELMVDETDEHSEAVKQTIIDDPSDDTTVERGAFINGAFTVTDSSRRDDTQVDTHSPETPESKRNKRFVRQVRTIEESTSFPDDGGVSPDIGSSSDLSLTSSQEVLNSSTLHTFLRMVSTQSTECDERLQSTDDAGRGHDPTEVHTSPAVLQSFPV